MSPESSRNPPDDTIPPSDWVQITMRIRPDLHAALENNRDRHHGGSINRQVNEHIEQGLARNGASAIARERRRMLPRGKEAQAALAYLLAYLGRGGEARRQWPWQGRLSVEKGDQDILVKAGALLATEYDRERRWATSAPSGVT